MDLSSRGPLPLLIYSEGTRLQVKYPIWYYYNVLRCTPSSAVHALISRAGPPRMVRPMYHLVVPGGLSPTRSHGYGVVEVK